MQAYMVNDYYVFTSYEDMTSLIRDIIHHSHMPPDQESHIFSIRTGYLDADRLIFQSDTEDPLPLRYESEQDMYYYV